ncbi:MAG: hypothetical protein BAJALOKI2v1_700014 [Promethearchaeota archaeon]|nr:MAG: hypothetical protein BAJALOKI2v1_700014 [Candidatus Lokiarchaeota archaeon]
MTPSKKSSSQRDLPISLQGIEIILRYLNQLTENNLLSMRNISRNTDLSMRVVKNVLIQLETLNLVKRVVEKNKVLPKWGITKLGKQVINSA